MKIVAAVLLGIFATFGFMVAGEYFVLVKMPILLCVPFLELAVINPSISLIVGVLIGLIAKERARVAAALGIGPWVIFLAIGTGRGHTAASWWLTMLAALSIYLALGIGTAGLVGGRTVRTEPPTV